MVIKIAVSTTKVNILQKLREHITDDPKSLYILVKGNLGSGKSWCSLSLAAGIDPTFIDNKEKRIVYNPTQFVLLMANRNVPEGSIVVWDEAQTSMNPRKHMTSINVALNTQLDTMRRDNIGLILNAPYKIDKEIIRKLDFEIETRDIDKGVRKTKVKFKQIDHDKDTDKLYKKYPRVTGEKLIPDKMNPLYIPAPDNTCYLKNPEKGKELIDYYEEKRDEFQTDITKKVAKVVIENQKEEMHMSKEALEQELQEYGFTLDDFGLTGKEEKKKNKKTKKKRIQKLKKDTDLTHKEIAGITGTSKAYVDKVSGNMKN